MRRPHFQVTMNQRNIMDYPLPKSTMVIHSMLAFEEQEARIFAGLSVMEYDSLPGVGEWCNADQPISKAEILVLYRLHNQVLAVQRHLDSKKKR